MNGQTPQMSANSITLTQYPKPPGRESYPGCLCWKGKCFLTRRVVDLLLDIPWSPFNFRWNLLTVWTSNLEEKIFSAQKLIMMFYQLPPRTSMSG